MKYTIREETSPSGKNRYWAYDENGRCMVGTGGDTLEECEQWLEKVVTVSSRVIKEIEIPEVENVPRL